jgi:sulfur-oxidizing protein SoxX
MSVGGRRWLPVCLWLVGCCGGPAVAQDRPLAKEEFAPSSVARGRALLANRHESGCVLCHTVPGLPAGGDLGPALAGLAERASAAQIRQRIADPRLLNPQTIMPAYFSTLGLNGVASAYAGRTVLTEQGLEDILAYLLQTTRAP